MRLCATLALSALFCAVRVVRDEGVEYDPWDPSNWVLVKGSSAAEFRPPARNGHAVAMLDGKMFLVAGRSNTYQNYDTSFKTSRADVWHAYPPFTDWIQEHKLTGDFHVQQFDALQPGSVAPFYARHGHCLVTVRAHYYGLGKDVLLLLGGFAPDPKNDVWVSADGRSWRFVGLAPWEGRAWHACAFYEGDLHVIGGTPLSNDMWRLEDLAVSGGNETNPAAEWSMSWAQMQGGADLWSPRAGHEVVVRYEDPGPLDTANAEAEGADDTGLPHEVVYLIGGFGGFPMGHSGYDDYICRRDVYRYTSSTGWQLVTEAAPWPARAWFGAAVWSHHSDEAADVNPSRGGPPRIWIMGGGFMGQSGNRRIDRMAGYVDAWWTSNGADWYQVNFQDGKDRALESSQEWASTTVDDAPRFIGKWGHSVIQATRPSDTNPNQEISALYLVAGDFVDDGDFTDRIYRTSNGILCDMEGITCNDAGVCLEDSGGCDCVGGFEGAYCEEGDDSLRSPAPRIEPFEAFLLASGVSCGLWVLVMNSYD